jgi:hypothetical protein
VLLFFLVRFLAPRVQKHHRLFLEPKFKAHAAKSLQKQKQNSSLISLNKKKLTAASPDFRNNFSDLPLLRNAEENAIKALQKKRAFWIALFFLGLTERLAISACPARLFLMGWPMRVRPAAAAGQQGGRAPAAFTKARTPWPWGCAGEGLLFGCSCHWRVCVMPRRRRLTW